MRVLVCGGRNYQDRDQLVADLDLCLETYGEIEIISGGADGADLMATVWAAARNVPCTTYFADWKKYGRKAGPIRNQQMIDEGKPGVVIAFPGGRGTADMVRRARQAGIQVCQP